ncbi:MAG: hypothetical protein WDN08_01450 [Rhizomicrobium sp.]
MNDPAPFILANTALIAPPLVPEIRLHLATEVVPLWRLTEEELQAQGVPPPYWAFAWAGGQALARHVLDNPSWSKAWTCWISARARGWSPSPRPRQGPSASWRRTSIPSPMPRSS